MLKKVLLIVGGVVFLLVAVVGLLAYSTFGTVQPLQDELSHGRVTQVNHGYVASYIVDLGDAGVALVDAGIDPEGTAIKAALEKMDRQPADVSAILITHGHSDHTAGIAAFPQADVYAHSAEIPLLHGEAAPEGPVTKMQGAKRVANVSHGLEDGQTFSLAEVEVKVFHVPGHTAGSAVYLIEGVLLLGDSASSGKKGELKSAPWIFTDDTTENRASLVALAQAVGADDVEILMFSHSASLDGVQALLEYSP